MVYKLGYSPKNSILEGIVQEAATSLQLEGITSYNDASEMQTALQLNKYIAGVQFDDKWQNITDYPVDFSFALRFPSELRTVSSNLPLTWLTSKLFMPIDLTGPRNAGSQDGGVPVGYLREAFLPIQNAITMAYMKFTTSNNDLPEVYMQRYPYPEYIYDPLLEGLGTIMSLIILLSFIYPCTNIVKVSVIAFSNCLHYDVIFPFAVYHRRKGETIEGGDENYGPKQLDPLDGMVCQVIHYAIHLSHIDNDSNESKYCGSCNMRWW